MKTSFEDIALETPRDMELGNVDKCVAHLIKSIELGEIHPDKRLGEPSLAKKLGIDRASVRVAFERLRAAGILKRVQGSGTYLNKLSVEEMLSASQVRTQLELLSVRLATAQATDREIDELMEKAVALDELNQTYFDGKKDIWRTLRSREIEFHIMIARCSRNFMLLQIMSRDSFLQMCFPFLLRIRELDAAAVAEYLGESILHASIVAAIRTRDAAAAELLMRGHTEGNVSQILRRLQPDDRYILEQGASDNEKDSA